MGSCCFKIVPVTDAMQITVSSDIEKRIDDNSSTVARLNREPVVNSMPSVDTVMGDICRVEKKGRPSNDDTALLGVKNLAWFP